MKNTVSKLLTTLGIIMFFLILITFFSCTRSIDENEPLLRQIEDSILKHNTIFTTLSEEVDMKKKEIKKVDSIINSKTTKIELIKTKERKLVLLEDILNLNNKRIRCLNKKKSFIRIQAKILEQQMNN